MIHMCVREKDAADGCAESAGSGENVVVGVGQAGVDEGEAVGLTHEVAINEAEAGELGGVGCNLRGFHWGLDAEGTLKGADLSLIAMI